MVGSAQPDEMKKKLKWTKDTPGFAEKWRFVSQDQDDKVEIDGLNFRVLSCPGHTVGHI